MTERDWVEGNQIRPLIVHAEKTGSERKLRLFALACCRRIEHLFVDQRSLAAIAALEKYIEGQCATVELEYHYVQAEDAIEAPLSDKRGDVGSNTQRLSACAAQYAVNPNIAPTQFPSAIGYSSAALSSAVFDRTQVWSAEVLAAEQAESFVQCQLIHDIFGNPFQTTSIDPVCLAWKDSTIIKLAQAIYLDRAFNGLPILGDALEEAGCTDANILSHCRGVGPHVRGCWVVDLLLGKE